MPAAIGIVAGEASGDLLGAHLIEALQPHFPQARFVGIGGPRMRSAGMDVLFPMETLAVRGYVEVARHYFEIIGIRRRLAAHFLRDPPACFIGIDAPDFNLSLERKLKRAGIATVQYVSPQIWAWRSERLHEIGRAVDKMLTVFPFEAALYEEARIPVAYVGHPLADMLGGFPGREAAREQLRVPHSARIIALLPGSRITEVEQTAELFVATAAEIAKTDPQIMFLAPLVSIQTRARFEAALYRRGTPSLNLTILFGHAHEAMAASDVVLVCSGTATLEAALLRRPMVITYRMPRLSWWIMKRRFRERYVGLPNILSGEFVVPELLQDDATPENLAQAVLNLLSDAAVRSRIEHRFSRLLAQLRQDTSQKVVEALAPMLRARLA
ncbi:MAG TPA: lipid-A-disaccharide synthase [Burkholderiales bacterium]|nr:lipid-A-disaccharide synthase [Burkholderiales bacterium]